MNADWTICPECGTQTRPGILVCPDCGVNMFDVRFGQTLLMSDLGGLPARGTASQAREAQSLGTQLTLQGRDGVSIQADCEKSVILGRINVHSPQRPDIDLTCFEAFQHGVSCRHARLSYMDDRIQLSDLGSTNGTYLNAERLIPHRAYPLKQGDEIRLGHLFLRVRFGILSEATDKA